MIFGTGSKLDAFGEVEPIAGAAAPADPIVLLEGDQPGDTQDGDSARRGVFGDADACGDVPDAERGGPALVVSLGGEGDVFKSGPGQRAFQLSVLHETKQHDTDRPFATETRMPASSSTGRGQSLSGSPPSGVGAGVASSGVGRPAVPTP